MSNKNRLILLDTYYYSPNGKSVKKAPSDFSEDLWKFIMYGCKEYKSSQDTLISDTADGGLRNQFYKDYGIKIKGVAKSDKLTMIDHVQDLLATKKLYVVNNKNNWIFLHEHKNYQWKEGTLESAKPSPDKLEYKLKKPYYNSHSDSSAYYYAEHTCDAMQYGTIMNLNKYGLKW